MKKFLILLLFLIIPVLSFSDLKDFGFKPLRTKLRYKEDLLKIYSQWLYADLDSTSQNIRYLELAYALPFDHPIKALTPITNEQQYEKYQSLIMMQICLLLTKEYIQFGLYYNKDKLYFFNKEFYTNYLEGYEIAEFYIKEAEKYWEIAKKHSEKASQIHFYNTDLYYLENQSARIKQNDLNYTPIIANLLSKIDKNRQKIKNEIAKN